MIVLGLNFFHANAAAALFVDGKLLAAAEEERFNRVKFSAGLPVNAIRFCLEQGCVDFSNIDVISYARNTNTRIVNQDQLHYQDRIYRIDSLYDRYRMNLKLINFKETLASEFGIPFESLVFKLRETDHHRSHIRSGYHYSPFDQTLLLSCDAFGDFITIRTGIVEESQQIRLLSETQFPHSIGLFYTMVSQFLGFSEYGDESKVMGLSTFGYPEFTPVLRRILSPEDGSFRLNLDYFDTRRGIGTTWSESAPDIGRVFTENLVSLLGQPRSPDEELDTRHQNLAASLQHLTEEIILGIVEDLCQQHPSRNLVFTGGLAYNSLLNGRIVAQTEIENLYVPPAPGNSGLAIGSALEFLGENAPREVSLRADLGPAFKTEEVATELTAAGLKVQEVKDPAFRTACMLAEGKTVGWFQGRMEFGPRTLGNRCILINPSRAESLRVKRRDYLKPFGIAILDRESAQYLREPAPSPFMSFMVQIRARHRQLFEGVLLNNYCRYQTVDAGNTRFHALLEEFRQQTDLPFLINTSLNAEGTPIIASPRDLIESLDDLALDGLAVEDIWVENPRSAGFHKLSQK